MTFSINSNANSIGTKGSGSTSSLPIQTGESISLLFLESDQNAATISTELKPVDSVELTFANTNGSVVSPTDITIIVHYSNDSTSIADYDAVLGKVSLDAGLLQIASVDIVNQHASEAFLVKEITTSTVVDIIEPADVQLDFQVDIVDGDGDSDSYEFSVGIDAEGSVTGTVGDDAILGTGGNDIITGGAGDDILAGNGGADIFVWNLGEQGTPAVDTITDFNDGDKLNLSDLLQGDELVGANINDYLSMTSDGATTTISVSHDPGNASGITQLIEVNGDLTAGNTVTLEALLANGTIVTEI